MNRKLARESGDRSIAEGSVKKIKNKEKEERRVKINESRCTCIKYKSIMTEKLPKDLEGKRKRKDRSLIAKYKCESETKGSLYGERSKTGVAECMVKEESIFHILKECEVTNELRMEKFRGRRQRSGNNEKEGSGREKENKEEGEY